MRSLNLHECFSKYELKLYPSKTDRRNLFLPFSNLVKELADENEFLN